MLLRRHASARRSPTRPSPRQPPRANALLPEDGLPASSSAAYKLQDGASSRSTPSASTPTSPPGARLGADLHGARQRGFLAILRVYRLYAATEVFAGRRRACSSPACCRWASARLPAPHETTTSASSPTRRSRTLGIAAIGWAYGGAACGPPCSTWCATRWSRAACFLQMASCGRSTTAYRIKPHRRLHPHQPRGRRGAHWRALVAYWRPSRPRRSSSPS